MKRSKPLKRSGRLPPVNPRRLARLRERQFGVQAELCREMPCAICGAPPPSDPQHTSARGMGGCKGEDKDVFPLCREHHQLVHQKGESALPITHKHLARVLHEALLVLAREPLTTEAESRSVTTGGGER